SILPTAYKLLVDCEQMADYAMDSGKELPQWLGKSLVEISSSVDDVKKEILDLQSLEEPDEQKETKVKMKLNEKLKSRTGDLSRIYNRLAEIVAPATPLSIKFTKPSVGFFKKGKKTIPIIRTMWLLSLFFLIALIVSRLDVLPTDIAVPVSLFFASGLGAFFFSLYTANKYVVSRTFDPKYVTFYYNRIIIGILSGYILANIIDVKALLNISENVFTQFSPYVIAILGGFSADAVIKVLNRIVAMLVTMVEGNAKELVKAKEDELRTKFSADLLHLKLNYSKELLPIITEHEGTADEETVQKLKELMNKWISGE
ncbi:MAG: hypothetical protein KJO59_16660, partial [Ignavibacteria bacterium]|nr:hypothetical protein [Ignavibacteria bacterium]